ncbi:MAG: pantetheine-phosphate adenylyltransferase [Myxococcales bacterium]|jgi:pantetheine-phosphate adenylyltransferase|nr:pantetheine-phosphate adenylyltransferase [Myxococcales bacterium]
MPRVAMYPGSFDPITVGHVAIIERGLNMFDEVVVAVARNISKSGLFSLEERIALIHEVMGPRPALRVETFEGLLVDYARNHGIGVILRGLRGTADFEYEYQMANMNRQLAPDVDTVFLMSDPETFYISSRLVKEVAQLGGAIDQFVPAAVRDRLLQRLGRP